MDPYATHQRLLLRAALATTGPILELGAGNYSTPLLHEIAVSQRRQLLTIDNDQSWLSRFSHLECSAHSLSFVKHWDEFSPNDRYGLAFIDHAPAERRETDIRRLLHLVDVFVLHDTESLGYGYEHVMPIMDHIDTDTRDVPWTTMSRGQIPIFKMLEIETQSTCNRTCPSCIRNSHPNRSKLKPWFTTNQMPVEVIEAILTQARSLSYCGAVCLSHYNEPLLDMRIAMIAQLVKQTLPNNEVFFHSNGDRLTNELARQLDGVVDRIVFSLYMTSAEQATRAEWIQSLFKRSAVSFTDGSHIPVHFSPIHPVRELAQRHATHPCLQPLQRLILNHRGDMLLCCEDVVGNFALGRFPDRSLADLWWSDGHQSIVRSLSARKGRTVHDYCLTCPRD